jgi:hypothetical protein
VICDYQKIVLPARTVAAAKKRIGRGCGIGRQTFELYEERLTYPGLL